MLWVTLFSTYPPYCFTASQGSIVTASFPGGEEPAFPDKAAKGGGRNEKNANLVILHLASLMRDQGTGQLWLWRAKEDMAVWEDGGKKSSGRGGLETATEVCKDVEHHVPLRD